MKNNRKYYKKIKKKNKKYEKKRKKESANIANKLDKCFDRTGARQKK